MIYEGQTASNAPVTGSLHFTCKQLLPGHVITSSKTLKLCLGFALEFPTGVDRATFWDKATEVSSLSWDKGTMG